MIRTKVEINIFATKKIYDYKLYAIGFMEYRMAFMMVFLCFIF